MIIRKATAREMLGLWGYKNIDEAPNTAKFFYNNISSGNAVFWTADNEGELIGELYVFLDLDDKDFADGKGKVYLCAYRIRNDYRGQGIGSQLIRTVLDDLKSSGYKCVTIGADDESHVKLYKHYGFSSVIKKVYCDPCAMDRNMQPEHVENGYWLMLMEVA